MLLTKIWKMWKGIKALSHQQWIEYSRENQMYYFCFCFHISFVLSSVSHPQAIWGQCFRLGSGLLSSIPAKFYWLILFFTFLATSFQLYKMFFWTKHKEAHCVLKKFIRQQQFSFSLLQFWGLFLGTYNATIFSLDTTLIL